MKRLLRPLPSAFLLGLALPAAAFALDPTGWKNRQTVNVAAPGLVRVTLPADTLDAAQLRAPDLRLVDANGQEQPYLPEAAIDQPRETRRPLSFSVDLTDTATQLTLATGTTQPLDSLELESPHPHFLKAARVEISSDRTNWTAVGTGVPVFRQWGAEHLRLPLEGRTAAYVRVTLDDFRAPPVPFTGAALQLAADYTPTLTPLEARIARREEFAGETVLTLALEGRHAPLARLEFETSEPLFTRRVTVATRVLHDGTAGERTLATGTIYRLELEGLPARAQLGLPLDLAPDTRELLVHIHNADSPPLAVSSVRVLRRPVSLVFHAPAAGRYTLLSGNPQANAPRYDLAVFARDLRRANAPVINPGPLQPNPGYRAPEALADVPLTGAALETDGWRVRRPVQLTARGVQELELDIGALAQARPDFADLRLLRAGLQVPFLLEQPDLSRSLALTLVPDNDPKRPTFSRWQLKLPRAHLPLRRLVFTSSTPLFQRSLRIYEKIPTDRGDFYDSALANALWSRAPGLTPQPLTVMLADTPRTDTLLIETDNGDNPAIALAVSQVTYPVVRLVFKAEATDEITLLYGKPAASAPRYDLSLVAGQLLSSERNVATLRAEEAKDEGFARGALRGLRGGPLFWGALILVVVVLLAIVARLLPKPPTAA
ncbi:MAG: DUF3999 family protein [Opitutae bacterium]|nr:DUF3999 family protein [Opitutae bacterium]